MDRQYIVHVGKMISARVCLRCSVAAAVASVWWLYLPFFGAPFFLILVAETTCYVLALLSLTMVFLRLRYLAIHPEEMATIAETRSMRWAARLAVLAMLLALPLYIPIWP